MARTPGHSITDYIRPPSMTAKLAIDSDQTVGGEPVAGGRQHNAEAHRFRRTNIDKRKRVESAVEESAIDDGPR